MTAEDRAFARELLEERLACVEALEAFTWACGVEAGRDGLPRAPPAFDEPRCVTAWIAGWEDGVSVN